MHRITRDHVVYRLDRQDPPVLEIDPGERLLLETFDARSGTITADTDLLERPHPVGSNPATGPVLVRGAEPGDSLAVHVEAIDLAPSGFLAVKKGQGLLASRATGFATRIVPIVDGIVHFGDLRFPANPMVGVVGTAPAGAGISTSYAGAHGGNMDNKFLGPGATAHLPVAVPGALLGLGDVHGAMGDGEITFIGLEIQAEVTIRVDLHKQTNLRRPRIETRDHWVTTGDGDSLAAAARLAADEMADLMMARTGLTFEEVYMLMSAAVDVQICQCCEPGEFPVTTRAVVSKGIVP